LKEFQVSVDEIFEHTKFPLDENPESPPENNVNPLSIHYNPQSTTEKLDYSGHLNSELQVRKLPISGNASTRRERLRKSLILEDRVRNLRLDLAHCTPKEGSLFLIYNAIPCILHMENRVGIKILTMLLVEGLSNVKDKRILEDVSSEGLRIQTFLKTIARVANVSVLGNEENPSQWEVPYDEKTKALCCYL